MGTFFRNALHSITRFPFLFIMGVAAYAVAASGFVGAEYGVPNLFIEDGGAQFGWHYFRNRPSFLTQGSLALAVTFAWLVVAFAEETDPGEASLQALTRRFLARFLPIAVLDVVLAALIVHFQAKLIDYPEVLTEHIRYSIIGAVAGLATSAVLLAGVLLTATLTRVRALWVLLGAYGLLILGAMLHGKLMPTVAMFILFALVSIVYVAIKLLPEQWRLASLALIVGLLMTGYALSQKAQFRGIERASGVTYYKDKVPLKEIPGPAAAAGTVDPVAALAAWKARLGERPPKLVIVTTSGGAYRATFWTSIILDHILAGSVPNGRFPGLAQNIGLLTGASGGMVAAAYFAATRSEQPTARPAILSKQLAEDIVASQTAPGPHQTAYPIPRDSLSLVAQQLIQKDLPSAFLPWVAKSDRGEVLEESWRTLHVSFAQLAQGEGAGWRPSLILSPTIVETGTPILISNLDLREMTAADARQLDFFRMFPEARTSFRLATAVRMNATFPFASPIVELPTVPARRVVDAGYYENFGIGTAVQYLRAPSVAKWLRENAAGVMILQIRAFRTEAPIFADHPSWTPSCRGLQKTERDAGPFGWLSGPLQAAAEAREASMAGHNDRELGLLQEVYGAGFLDTVVFENTARSSASWYLPSAEFDCLNSEAISDFNVAALERLGRWWKATGAAAR